MQIVCVPFLFISCLFPLCFLFLFSSIVFTVLFVFFPDGFCWQRRSNIPYLNRQYFLSFCDIKRLRSSSLCCICINKFLSGVPFTLARNKFVQIILKRDCQKLSPQKYHVRFTAKWNSTVHPSLNDEGTNMNKCLWKMKRRECVLADTAANSWLGESKIECRKLVYPLWMGVPGNKHL